jgi:hypothetical protein
MLSSRHYNFLSPKNTGRMTTSTPSHRGKFSERKCKVWHMLKFKFSALIIRQRLRPIIFATSNHVNGWRNLYRLEIFWKLWCRKIRLAWLVLDCKVKFLIRINIVKIALKVTARKHINLVSKGLIDSFDFYWIAWQKRIVKMFGHQL